MRYATLATPTLRTAYETAMGKMRRQFTLTPAGRPIVPDKVAWLSAEMLKTRLAHGYCSRDPAAGACPYANICENCDNFVPADDATPVLRAQLHDISALRDDASRRGWDSEAARHARAAASISGHPLLPGHRHPARHRLARRAHPGSPGTPLDLGHYIAVAPARQLRYGAALTGPPVTVAACHHVQRALSWACSITRPAPSDSTNSLKPCAPWNASGLAGPSMNFPAPYSPNSP